MDEDELRILARVKEALSQSPAWNKAGFLQLTPKWVNLKASPKAAPPETGLYALGLPCGVRYDKGDSRIVYFGSAQNLQKRLSAHVTKPRNKVVELLQHNFADGLLATWWTIPQFNRKFLFGIEGEALRAFERRFDVVPIGNLDIPEFFEGQEYCDGLVNVVTDDLDSPLTLEELAHKLGRIVVRRELEPGGVALTLSMVNGFLRTGGPCLRAAAFLTREQVVQEKESQQTQALRLDEDDEEQQRLLGLALIHDVNLAAWSADKMTAVVELCNALTPKRTRAKTVRPYEAPFREVPKPHTWGEVALIQARAISGTWHPEKQVWVKVMYGSELLGEGKLLTDHYRGEDKSDLPQRQTERPVCRDYEPSDEAISLTEEREEIYGVETTVVKTTSDIDPVQELRQSREAMHKAIEDLFQACMSRFD